MAAGNPNTLAVADGRQRQSLLHAAVDSWHASALIIVAGLIVFVCLFSRVMTEPLRHDEHIYFAAAVLLDKLTLYQDISFSHLPNLPIFLRGFMELIGSDHLFQTARLFTFFCWVAFVPGFAMLCWELSKNLTITLLCTFLLLTNSLIVDYVGMLVAAHLMPICLASYGFLFFLYAMNDERVSPWWMILAGVFLSLSVGTKANYIFVIPPFVIAACCLPGSVSFGRRLWRALLPLSIGGLLGGLPTLYYFAFYTDVLLFNILDFHLGPHRSYWSEPANAATVTGLTLGERLFYAYRLWGSGSTVLLLVTIAFFGAMLIMGGNARTDSRVQRWPLLIAFALAFLGMLVCFIVKPSFPQYYMPPLPFAVILIAALAGMLSETQLVTARPFITAIALSTLLLGGPMLAQSLPKLASPSSWTGNKVHQTALALRHVVESDVDEPKMVATLVPIYPLEAGLDVYPELASGPFYYRIGDYLSNDERESFGVTSPMTVGTLLDERPPAAILVGHEGSLDNPLVSYAEINGYQLTDTPIGRDRYGESSVYLKPRN